MKRKKCGSISAARPKRRRPSAKSARPLRGEEEIKTKIDLSQHLPAGRCAESHYATEGSGCAADRTPASSQRLRRSWQARGRAASRGPTNAASGCAHDFRAAVTPAPFNRMRPAAVAPSLWREPTRAARSDSRLQWPRRRVWSRRLRLRGCASGRQRLRLLLRPRRRLQSRRRVRLRRRSYWTAAASCAAHDRSADWTTSGVQSSAAASGRAGRTDARPVRPRAPCVHAPGRPVPGQPIFQRPRPMAPGGGPPRPLRPGERRPMHPTRTAPAGARPLGVGPGLSASGTRSSRCSSGSARAPARPALCSARCKRRPDEGLHAAAAHGGVE